eukprot:11430380-Ditylum_brightwellii.AAC.1
MKEPNCPLALWVYYVKQRALSNNLTANDSFKLNVTTPHTALTDRNMSFPFNKDILGHNVGPTEGEGNEMEQWVVK